MRRWDIFCRAGLFFGVAFVAAAAALAGYGEMADRTKPEGAVQKAFGLARAEAAGFADKETGGVRTDIRAADTEVPKKEGGNIGAAEAAAGAGRTPAPGCGAVSKPDMVFQEELEPQSAMEAGQGMRWEQGWEFAEDGEKQTE